MFSELASGRAGSQWPPEPQDPLPAWFLIITTLPPIQVDVLLIFKHEQVKKVRWRSFRKVTITTWPPRYRCRLSSISAKKYKKKTLFLNFESFFQIYSLSVLNILTLIFACFDISYISHVTRARAEACCAKDRNILLKNGRDVFWRGLRK